MQRVFWLLLVSLIIPITANAQGYVRKAVRPAFFIPPKEFEKAEKLPPFPEPEVIVEEEENIDYNIPAPAEQANNLPNQIVAEQPKVIHYDLRIKPHTKEIEVEKVVPEDSNDTFKDKTEDIQSYKNIKNEYEKDLKIISQTKRAPQNKNVDKDLAKMNSDEKIWVDDDFGKQ